MRSRRVSLGTARHGRHRWFSEGQLDTEVESPSRRGNPAPDLQPTDLIDKSNRSSSRAEISAFEQRI
jgi:hypothetical protein